MRNLELKARYENLQQAETIARQLGLEPEWIHVQKDIYFDSKNGKLKLRLVDDKPGELIFYNRPAAKDASISDYMIYNSNQPEMLLTILQKAYTITNQVIKTRKLYLYENIRIHLDEVKVLGNFIEFEGVMSGEADASSCQTKLDFLEKQFNIRNNDKIEHGYYELLTME